MLQSALVCAGGSREMLPNAYIEEEDSNEFERNVDQIQGQYVCRRAYHCILTVTNDDRTLGVGNGDYRKGT